MGKDVSSSTSAPTSKVAGSAKSLGFWGFFAITASMVMTVYEYPTFATAGYSLIFYLLLGGIFWFIPVALCAAEMATVQGWQKGGLFTWVEKTLGARWGFAAIFFQWFQITVGFVTMIYFIVGALSYVLNWTELNDNMIIKLIAVLIIFWAITFSQFGGTKNTSRLAKAGFFIGILATGIILFILSITYMAEGNQWQTDFTSQPFIPNFGDMSTLVVFVSFILAYAGVEGSASHANEMKNPGRDYPLAILLLVICAIVLDTLGGFTVGATIPQNILGLNTGVIQAYEFLINHFAGGASLDWIVRIISLVICLGVIAEIASWVVGPSTALLDAAQKGLLPKTFTKVNKHNVPTHIIYVQGIVVSIWACILTLGGGGGNLSFFVAMALTVCVYLVGYVLLFLAYIRLTHKHADLPRAYKIPGGKGFKTLVAVVGIIVSVFAFVVSFFPPSNFASEPSEQTAYLIILIVCWVVMVIIPFIIYQAYGKKHYRPNVTNDDGEVIVDVHANTNDQPAIPHPDAPKAAADGGK